MNKLSSSLPVFFLVLFVSQIYSQSKRGNTWVLGRSQPEFHQGILIDFNNGAPDSHFLQKELDMGGATNLSISDNHGRLLFYSNGCSISDSRNEVIQEVSG